MATKDATRLAPAARRFLEEKRFAVLATTNPDGTPQQTVMWYELRGDGIVMNTTRDRVKFRNLSDRPRASFLVEDGYRFLRVEGPIELIAERERAQDDIRRLAIRYQGREAGERMAREAFSKEERVTLLLHVEDVLARGIE